MRTLSLVLALTLGAALISCGGDADESTEGAPATSTAAWTGAVAGSVTSQIQSQVALASPEDSGNKTWPQQVQPQPQQYQQPQMAQPSQPFAQPQQQYPVQSQPQTQTRNIWINGAAITPHQMTQLQTIASSVGYQIPDGQFWYDPMCGLWGTWGGPALGYVPAGMTLGGPLPPNASGGGQGTTTGVFINGREMHPIELSQLRAVTQVLPGRYWLDAQGNGGFEGGPATFNLLQLAQQQQGGGNAWSHSSWTPSGNAHVGGDGSGYVYFLGPDGTSWSSD